MKTLRQALTQSKPVVPCQTRASKNSQGKWPHFKAEAITIWNDFNLATLNKSYGHVLDLEMPAEQLATVPRSECVLTEMEIAKPIDILRLVGWNDRLLRPTLSFAKQHLNLSTGVHLLHTIAKRLLTGSKQVHPDHVVALDDFPLPNLVAGLGRPSSKFQGRQVFENPHQASKESLWPLRQLAHSCAKAKTRYGYIVTDQDLVVCCFEREEAGSTMPATESTQKEQWKVAAMPIPWTRYGEGQLTTDLALWWLCMLALSAPENRDLACGADLVGIGDWEVCQVDDERGWVRRHRYSGFEQASDPPPPSEYQSPSPGNAAAFAAAAASSPDLSFNLNGDSWADWDAFMGIANAEEPTHSDAAADGPA